MHQTLQEPAQQLREAKASRQAAREQWQAQEQHRQEAQAAEQAQRLEQLNAYLTHESHERQKRIQAAQERLQARLSQAYHGWSAVPEGLCTRTQLQREGLRVPAGVQPVAEVYAPRHGKYGYEFYELYRREDAVPKLERKPRDYNSIFEKRYPDRQSALKDAAEALFNLNRYAKHETCADDHQALIYELKNRFIEYLWQMGYCTESVHIRSVPIEYECFRCEGSGIHWESGEDCRH